jgi:hypothetical protein
MQKYLVTSKTKTIKYFAGSCTVYNSYRNLILVFREFFSSESNKKTVRSFACFAKQDKTSETFCETAKRLACFAVSRSRNSSKTLVAPMLESVVLHAI